MDADISGHLAPDVIAAVANATALAGQTIRCECGGVVQGALLAGTKACGNAFDAKDVVMVGVDELPPMTECARRRIVRPPTFNARVAALLRRLCDDECPDCRGYRHRKGCKLAALLRECEA